MDFNVVEIVGEFYIFFWDILLFGEIENEDIFRYFFKVFFYYFYG